VNRRIWCNGCASVTPLNVTLGKNRPLRRFFYVLHKSRTTSMVAVTCSPLCQWIIGVVISMVISMVISI